MVLEEGKFYPLMKAVPGKADREWTEEELEFGKFLLEKCHPVLRQYLERELRIRKEILERLKDMRKCWSLQDSKRRKSGRSLPL